MAPSDLLSLIVTAPSYQAPLALMIGLVGLAYGGNLLVPATLSLPNSFISRLLWSL